jgi:HPt (histidine-containing phosphotransfer) domain-containing protein
MQAAAMQLEDQCQQLQLKIQECEKAESTLTSLQQQAKAIEAVLDPTKVEAVGVNGLGPQHVWKHPTTFLMPGGEPLLQRGELSYKMWVCCRLRQVLDIVLKSVLEIAYVSVQMG